MPKPPEGVKRKEQSFRTDRLCVSAALERAKMEQFRRAIAKAVGAQLNQLAVEIAVACDARRISEADAGRLFELIQTRRKRTAAPKRRRKLPDAFERRVRRERAHRLALANALPASIGWRFTRCELAVLAVIAFEVKARDYCDLTLGELCDRAGVSRTLAQNAIRIAEELGLMSVQTRPRPGAKSLPNVLRIVSKEWLVWLRGKDGFRNAQALETNKKKGGPSLLDHPCTHRGTSHDAMPAYSSQTSVEPQSVWLRIQKPKDFRR